jgi:hypothetical protein
MNIKWPNVAVNGAEIAERLFKGRKSCRQGNNSKPKVMITGSKKEGEGPVSLTTLIRYTCTLTFRKEFINFRNRFIDSQ